MMSTIEKLQCKQKEDASRMMLQQSRIARKNVINAISTSLDQNFSLAELNTLYTHLLQGHRLNFETL